MIRKEAVVFQYAFRRGIGFWILVCFRFDFITRLQLLFDDMKDFAASLLKMQIHLEYH
jgi:hypothetical protein